VVIVAAERAEEIRSELSAAGERVVTLGQVRHGAGVHYSGKLA